MKFLLSVREMGQENRSFREKLIIISPHGPLGTQQTVFRIYLPKKLERIYNQLVRWWEHSFLCAQMYFSTFKIIFRVSPLLFNL